jgi:hypothetical protein
MVIGISGLTVLRRRATPLTPVATVVLIAGVSSLAATLAMLAIGPVGLRYRISLTAFLYLGVGALIARLVDRHARFDLSQAVPAHVSIR